MRHLLFSLSFIFIGLTLQGQVPELKFQSRTIPQLPALHSFAWAKWENKLLLVGGRTDGLHQK